jgi:DNA-binding IclR family transcriptional regulator
MLFEVLLLGEHALHGLTNRDLRHKLARTSYPLAPEFDKRPGQVTRLLRRLHAHGLVAKIPHSRRWRVSLAGRRTMTTAIKLREVAYPSLFAAAA